MRQERRPFVFWRSSQSAVARVLTAKSHIIAHTVCASFCLSPRLKSFALCPQKYLILSVPRFIFRKLFLRVEGRHRRRISRRIIFFNAYRVKLVLTMKCGSRHGGVGDLRHPNETLIFFSRGSLGQLAQTFASCTG